MGNLPRYKISINPEDAFGDEKLGMDAIAYTATPAIMAKGIYFNEKKMKFKDELKMRVAAPALIPNIPIYRFDEEMGEYEVVFSEEVIEQLREDFMLNKGQSIFNLDHNPNEKAPSYILDSWITDEPERDQSFLKYGIELPKGSWFVVSQFTDKEYFQEEIINKDRAAYSIEGFLGLALSNIKQKLKADKMKKHKFEVGAYIELPVGVHTIGGKLYTVVEIIENEGLENEYRTNVIESMVPVTSENNLNKQEKMENETKQKFAMHKLIDGTPVWISEVKKDSEVFIIDESMEKAPIFDGTHELEDGTKLVTVAGKITEVISKAEEPVAETPAEEVMAETPVVDAPVAETPAAPEADATIDEAAILKVVQPKLDEIMLVISELKTMVESMNIVDPATEEVEMSAAEKLNFAIQKLRNL